MELTVTSIVQRYRQRYKERYGRCTTEEQWSAINAICGCRTEQYGHMDLSCSSCGWQGRRYHSCGHRACNQCQHHNAVEWVARQQQKLLPVKYFMVTFTLPQQLRELARTHQRTVYDLLLQCASSTLKTFGLNDKRLQAEVAMTAVLHTHTRSLDYHPHVHMVVPAGVVDTARKQWRKIKGKYLFNGTQLAAAFRGCFLRALQKVGLLIPATPKKWVVQCQRVGHGLPALKYLSRYLYRGVISNRNLIEDDGQWVTFRYQDNQGQWQQRRLTGEDFIALILQHTLPKGFRRVRDYGFLHGNAKRVLKLVQWILRVVLPDPVVTQRPEFTCPRCQQVVSIVAFSPPRLKPG